MSINIGVNIQRSPNRINQALRAAGVNGQYPKLLFDFDDEYYLTGGSSKTFANAMTFARAGLATMVDGYGSELITNGTFTNNVDGWTATLGNISWNDGRLNLLGNGVNAYPRASQDVTTIIGKLYVVEFNFEFVVAGITVEIDGTAISGGAITSSGKYSFSFIATDTTSNVQFKSVNNVNANALLDNISVREAPVIKWAPHNFLLYSESFNNAPWARTVAAVTADATIAPDGTQTADSIIFVGVGSVAQQISMVADTVVTNSMYVKANSGSGYCRMLILNAGRTEGFGGWFNTSTGAWGTTSATSGSTLESSTAESVGNGWYKISLTGSIASTSVYEAFNYITDADNSTTRSTTVSQYWWGAHLYRSDLGGMVNNPDRGDSYVPTTSSAVYLPRRGHHKYNGDQWVNKGILVESEARTNLLDYSIPDSNWSQAELSVTQNATISPDGNANASKIAETSATASHYCYSNIVSISSGQSYTDSAIVKAGTHQYMQLVGTSSAFGSQVYATFDLSDGTIGTTGGDVTSATIEPLGNGWYRCSITGASVATVIGSAGIIALVPSKTAGRIAPYTGSTSNYIYAYGSQFESASTPSSYIPTNGSSVTRAAETVTVPYANLPWPTPTYIGDELVTNGTFDSDTSGWSANVSASLSVVSQQLKVERIATGYGQGYQTVTVTAGKVYEVSAYGKLESGATGWILIGDTSATQKYVTQGVPSGGASYTFYIVPDSTNIKITGQTHNVNIGDAVILDNISVREINPLSVSIAMMGEVDYVDKGLYQDVTFFRWYDSSNDRIDIRLDGNSINEGKILAVMAADGVQDVSYGVNQYILDGSLNAPFDIAGRYTTTTVQAGYDGSVATPDTNATKLPDLSGTDLELGQIFMGTISEFRMWDKDLGDTGIAEATKPSLEPSLSLTFDGQPSSFTNSGLTV